jgi:putative ABC transport system substrate-binding protein
MAAMRVAALLAAALAWAPHAVTAAPARAGSPPRVVVVRANASEPYEVALRALEAALAPDVAVEVATFDPDSADGAARAAALQADVLVPLGTRPTSLLLEATRDIPIVFAMVLNPVNSGLVASIAAPGGRVTGAALDVPPESQLEALRSLVGARRVGVLFDPAKTGGVVRDARAAAARVGIELVGIEVTEPAALERALRGIDDSIEALWSVADPTVLGRGAVEQLLLHTLEERIPYMGISEQYVRAGALAAIATSYAENGRLAADRVRRVLAGESPGSIAVGLPKEIEVVWNPRTARRLEIELPTALALPLREVP